MKNHITFFSGSFILCQQLIKDLEAENINSILKNHQNSSVLAGFATHLECELLVLDTDFEQAKKILENFNKKIQ